MKSVEALWSWTPIQQVHGVLAGTRFEGRINSLHAVHGARDSANWITLEFVEEGGRCISPL